MRGVDRRVEQAFEKGAGDAIKGRTRCGGTIETERAGRRSSASHMMGYRLRRHSSTGCRGGVNESHGGLIVDRSPRWKACARITILSRPARRKPKDPPLRAKGRAMTHENSALDDKTRTELEAAAFRRLLEHLRARADVQNIDLMNRRLRRNCLSDEGCGRCERRADEQGREPRGDLRHAVRAM